MRRVKSEAFLCTSGSESDAPRSKLILSPRQRPHVNIDTGGVAYDQLGSVSVDVACPDTMSPKSIQRLRKSLRTRRIWTSIHPLPLSYSSDSDADTTPLSPSKIRSPRADKRYKRQRQALTRAKSFCFFDVFPEDSDHQARGEHDERKMFDTLLRDVCVLPNQGLQQVPPSVLTSTQLTILNLSHNELQSLPAAISNLTNLTALRLDMNQMTSVCEDLGKLGNTLTRLTLSNNHLTTIPHALHRLTALKRLELASNRIARLDNIFSHMTLLTELKLQGNGLDELPRDLSLLHQLTHLNVSNNNLTVLPSLEQCTLLRVLNIAGNRFRQFESGIYSDIPNLQHFNASSNELVLFPSALRSQTRLITLNLHSNRLRDVPIWIKDLAMLEELFLQDNRLEKIASSIMSLQWLRVLYISSNRPLKRLPSRGPTLNALTELIIEGSSVRQLPVEFCSIFSLQSLALRQNYLQRLPDEIGQLLSLRLLYLDDNQLSSLPASIGNLTTLQRLSVCNNRLQDLPESIGRLSSLVVLAADGNRLTALPREIACLKALESLSLVKNEISRLPVEMGTMWGLRFLSLDGTHLRVPPAALYYRGIVPALHFLRQVAEHGEEYALQHAHTQLVPCDEIDPDEVSMCDVAGRGAFGEVWRAIYRGQTVAVKKFNWERANDADFETFCREVSYLSKIPPESTVVRFIGASYRRDCPMIVTQYVSRGSLRDNLQSEHFYLSPDDIILFAYDIAWGMRHLHTCFDTPVLHRDLSTRNLLVTDDNHILVADFGMSRFESARVRVEEALDDSGDFDSDTYMMFPGRPQTLACFSCAAPEVLKEGLYSTKSDVFAYGVVLWEMLTRMEPFAGQTVQQKPDRCSGGRLKVPHTAPQWQAELIRACWQQDPELRPNFVEIVHHLEDLRKEAVRNKHCPTSGQLHGTSIRELHSDDSDTAQEASD